MTDLILYLLFVFGYIVSLVFIMYSYGVGSENLMLFIAGSLTVAIIDGFLKLRKKIKS